jgi:hypothetical protein
MQNTSRIFGCFDLFCSWILNLLKTFSFHIVMCINGYMWCLDW